MTGFFSFFFLKNNWKYKKWYITQSSDIFEMYAFYFKHFLYDEHTLQYKKQLWGQWNDICDVIDCAPVCGCHG